MSNQTIELNAALYEYLLGVSLREPEVLRELRAETAKLEHANMQIAPEQGQFMALLAKLLGARRYLEIGTFTGYSALVIALALPADGQVYALDLSDEWTSIARRYWERAGVAERIRLILGDAHETLQPIVEKDAERFDFIFVDADKTGYARYIDAAHRLLRTGGLLALDNTLWSGAVANPEIADEDTVALRAVNEALFGDERFDISLVPIGDGLTLARKR
jgi:predicted O-methyltransferase YrrM